GNAVARCPTIPLHGLEKPIGYVHDDRAGTFASIILHTLTLETRIGLVVPARQAIWRRSPAASATAMRAKSMRPIHVVTLTA
ncbi:hypothetical protein, partial [Neomesorhizobium albiziae]